MPPQNHHWSHPGHPIKNCIAPQLYPITSMWLHFIFQNLCQKKKRMLTQVLMNWQSYLLKELHILIKLDYQAFAKTFSKLKNAYHDVIEHNKPTSGQNPQCSRKAANSKSSLMQLIIDAAIKRLLNPIDRKSKINFLNVHSCIAVLNDWEPLN